MRLSLTLIGRVTATSAVFTALALSSTSFAKAPEAPETNLLEEASFSAAYAEDPLVKTARERGLTRDILRVIDAPETPHDVRTAILDAVMRAPGSSRVPNVYATTLTRRLERSGRAPTIGALATHEAFALGYMIAHANPDTLRPKDPGASEIQRAGARMLLTAAVNRQRGDLSIRLVDALVKSQLAISRPDERLCAPHTCIDDALAPYTTEWSMRPEAVCAAVDAVADLGDDDPKASSTCAKVRKKRQGAPLYSQDARAEEQAQRFSQATPRRSKNAPPMGALPPGMSPQMLQAMGLTPQMLQQALQGQAMGLPQGMLQQGMPANLPPIVLNGKTFVITPQTDIRKLEQELMAEALRQFGQIAFNGPPSAGSGPIAQSFPQNLPSPQGTTGTTTGQTQVIDLDKGSKDDEKDEEKDKNSKKKKDKKDKKDKSADASKSSSDTEEEGSSIVIDTGTNASGSSSQEIVIDPTVDEKELEDPE